MLETQLLAYLFNLLAARLAEARRHSERGDVAEKIVIVGIFVAIALAVGIIIKTAITTDATRIAHQIAP
jgi:hypothetical protein